MKKFLISEGGYLLLENLVTIMLLFTILIVTYPILVDWYVQKEQIKAEVECSRVLYESSMKWPEEVNDVNNQVIYTPDTLTVRSGQGEMRVEIFESHFE